MRRKIPNLAKNIWRVYSREADRVVHAIPLIIGLVLTAALAYNIYESSKRRQFEDSRKPFSEYKKER